jgi:cytochrome c biogenesis protein CcdA
LAIYDFFKFKKSGKTEGLALQLPQAVKNQIHSVIGLHYRKTGDKNEEIRALLIFRLILSAFVSGFLVSILEAICTGQMYLPTITFVLKTSHLKLQALGYLLLYNLMFVLPLFVIFILALFGTTSRDFSCFLNKHLLTVKILMAILFFSLGIFLIWKG